MATGIRYSAFVIAALVGLQFVEVNVEAAIVVSSDIVLDGLQNPLSGMGVTLSNNVYTFPDALEIGSGATIYLDDPFAPGSVTNPITWNFGVGVGGITFTDATSTIDVYVGGRAQGERAFTLNMNDNAIGGATSDAGRIINGIYVIGSMKGDPMSLDINSLSNVSIGTIDLTKSDAHGGRVDITAEGAINIGSITNREMDAGGSTVLPVTIVGGSATVGSIDTRNMRNNSASTNGNIAVSALAPPGFSATDAVNNTVAENIVTLNGLINTNGAIATHTGGNLTVNGAKVVLGSSFGTTLDPQATFVVNTGLASGGFTQASVFMNNSSVTPTTVNFNVYHDGVVPGTFEWDSNASGNWHGNGNWDLNSAPNLNNQTARFGAAITSQQTVYLNEAATVKNIQFDTTSSVAIAGTAAITLDADTGSASIAATQGSHEVQVGLTLADNTTFSASNGARLDVNNAIALGGKTLTISGGGQVNINHNATGGGAIVNSGTLGTAGATSIAGTLSSTGVLDIDVGGIGVAAFDAFNITGAATLSGLLNVDVVDGFSPTAGQTFTVLTASSVSAASLTLGGPDASLFSLIKGGTSLVLQALGGGAGLAGDFNGDHVVNAADYTVWRDNLGAPTEAALNGNGNGSNGVDQADYNLWKGNFGLTSPGAGSLSSAAVPEPTALVLALIGGAGIIGRRRRSNEKVSHRRLAAVNLRPNGVALAVIVASLVFSPPSAQAAILVSSDIVLDGVQNPLAGSGVTLVNNVYTFPSALQIGAGATIYFDDPNAPNPTSNDYTRSVTWDFPAGVGGITFADATSAIDVFVGRRNAGSLPQTFTLNMNDNPISGLVAGAGKITNSAYANTMLSGDPMSLDFNSTANISIGTINLTKSDSRGGAVDIVTEGALDIGSIANPDMNTGGTAVLNIDLAGKSVTVGAIDSANRRTGGPQTNGNVTIRALAPPTFSTTSTGNLVAENVVTLNGAINTNGALATHTNGNLTVTGAKVVLGSGFSATLDPQATFTVNTGLAIGGYTQASVFMNSSATTPTTTNYTVYHDGIAPPVAIWNTNSSGVWTGTSNWDIGSAPNSNSQTARFAAAVTTPQTVFLNQAVTVKSIEFDTAAKVAVGGTAGITLDADAGSATIQVLQGSHEIQVPLTLADNLTVSASAGTQLNLNNAIALSGKTLTISGAGQVRINHSATGGTIVNSGSGSLGTDGGASIGGDFVNSGTLIAEFSENGSAGGSLYDVAGAASIGGQLYVDFAKGFTFDEGDVFNVVTAGQMSVSDLMLTGADAKYFSYFVEGNSLKLQAISSVPEPASLVLAGLVGVAVCLTRRK